LLPNLLIALGAVIDQLDATDELAPGARLPAERGLTVEYGMTYDTIRLATALLRDRELIITIMGRRIYVAQKE
jgi:DNA-binding GntR family transcriptional regulator